jgi:Cro/C1-type HTH DNA-binding domain
MAKAFREQLAAAIENSGMTRYAISKATGIPQSQLSLFVNGRGGLAMESVDAICELLGLKLVGPANRKRAKKGK